MHQSPQKNLPRRRDRELDAEPVGPEAQRRTHRAQAAAKGRNLQWPEESPRAGREESRTRR
jgi:hypothetical protein